MPYSLETADAALFALKALMADYSANQDSSIQPFNDVQAEIFYQCWEGLTYSQIAELRGYDADYIKKVGSQLWQQLSIVFGHKVTKKNLKTALKQHLITLQDSNSTDSVLAAPIPSTQPIQDWGDAPDSSFFWGRAHELDTLYQWILEQRCKLVTLLGIGGVGKTVLSIKVAQKLQSQFAYVIWRNLKDMPPLIDFLSDLLRILSNQQTSALPTTSKELISLLTHQLQTSNCLIVLDNLESLLQQGEHFGQFQSGYEGYGDLLTRLGEVNHQSSIIVTTRELPEDIAIQAGIALPVRVLKLSGLDPIATQEILKAKGLTPTASETQALVEAYQGNPLALKIAATSIGDIFAGNISEFLEQETITFNGIRRLLDQQRQRLSPLEEQILSWLAIGREPVQFEQLEENLFELESKARLLEALEFLSRRSLIEKVVPQSSSPFTTSYTLQPVVMEYITERLISQACLDIENQTFKLLRYFSLVQVQAKDYVREVQIRLILQPIKRSLTTSFKDPSQLEMHLKEMLTLLQRQSSERMAYAAGNLLNLLRICEAEFAGLDLSSLTIWQADFRGIKLHHANFRDATLNRACFSETLGSIFNIVFSHRGDLLALSDDVEVKVYKYPNYQKFLTLAGHRVIVWTIAFSEDDHVLASGGSDHTVKIWNIETGDCLCTLEGHTGPVMSLAFQPQKDASIAKDYILATASQDHSVKLWNVDTEECFRIIQIEHKAPRSLTFSSCGELLAIGYTDGDVSILHLSTETSVWLSSEEISNEMPLEFSPNNRILAVGYSNGMIRLWDLMNQQIVKVLHDHTSSVFSLSYSADGHKLASSYADNNIRIWDPKTGEILNRLQGHTARVSSLNFHPNSQILGSSGEDSTVRIWDANSGQLLDSMYGHNDIVWSVACCPTSQTLVSGSNDQGLRLWDFNTGECHKELVGHTGRVKSVAFSSDGQLVVSATYNYQIKVWNATNGECLNTLQIPDMWCWMIALCPDNRILACSGGDNHIYLLDIERGKTQNTLKGHSNYVFGLQYSPDNKYLVSSSADQSIKRWDIETGECLQTIQSNTWLWSVTHHPDKPLLATAGDNGMIQMFDIARGECINTLEGHHTIITSVAFSPDGHYIASGSFDHTVRVWDSSSGHCIHVLEGHTDGIFTVAFSSDSTMLASGSNDETVKVWDVKTGELLQTMQPPRIYEGMNIKGVRGLNQTQINSLEKLGAISD